ncbi:MAG: hypothetical protein JNJ44_09940 [Zoogloeaceae bacterium]|nr:hypothetical protein [Zoogloeaceae bacterium]
MIPPRPSARPPMFLATLAVAALAGCHTMPMHHDRPQGDADLSEVAKRFVDPNYAMGALVVGQNGEIIAVDASGKPVPPCSLPSGAAGDTKQAPAPECSKVRNTTITDVQAPAIVRHTGSTCTLVGPIIHAGRAYYFQLPPGCKP